jgi:hypothetical protein
VGRAAVVGDGPSRGIQVPALTGEGVATRAPAAPASTRRRRDSPLVRWIEPGIRVEFKNEFKRSSKAARGRLGTLDDETQLIHPQGSLNVLNESTFLPRWKSRVRSRFPLQANLHDPKTLGGRSRPWTSTLPVPSRVRAGDLARNEGRKAMKRRWTRVALLMGATIAMTQTRMEAKPEAAMGGSSAGQAQAKTGGAADAIRPFRVHFADEALAENAALLQRGGPRRRPSGIRRRACRSRRCGSSGAIGRRITTGASARRD